MIQKTKKQGTIRTEGPNSNYKFILKKQSYKDISFLGVLKTLYKKHKLNKYQYKESIQRIINKKPLKNNVYTIVHYYLHTIKTNTSKSTLLALNKQDNTKQFVRFCQIKYRNNLYDVTLKKSKFLTLYYNKHLCKEYKDLMIIAISKEFKQLMGGLDDIIIL